MSAVLDQFLAAMRGHGCDPKPNGSGWAARCPAHDDDQPSLSVKAGDNGCVVVKCHAGCEVAAIVEALGLTMRDLFANNTTTRTKARRVVATYDYCNEDGDLLFQAVRYDPKDFRQRRPNGTGGWIWNMQGVRRVLYRLLDLLKAPLEAFIYIVEGEKDADRLRNLGLISTCNPMGAGKWAKVEAAPLHGHQVVIIPDNDEPGRKHATQVATSLHSKAASVRILQLPDLPEHGDVADWLDAGHDMQNLEELVQQVPIWEPTAGAGESDGNTELTIKFKRDGAGGDLTLLLDGEVVYVDRGDPRRSSFRERVVKEVCDEHKGVGADKLRHEMMGLAKKLASGRDKDDDDAAADREKMLAGYDMLVDKRLAAMPAAIREAAANLLEDPCLVDRVLESTATVGVVGEQELVLQLYLLGVSRLLDEPLASIVQGASSSGKSFAISRVVKLFPPESLLVATDLTTNALYYLPPGRLLHRFVVAGERSRLENDDRAEATRALREMIASGELTKAVPQNVGGKIETVILHQDGPIAFVESTTLTSIFEEDANRALLLTTDESEEQTRNVTTSIAADAIEPSRSGDATIQTHHALQRMLRRVEVRVEFADVLAEKLPVDRIEARRAFRHALSMIRAVATLHQRQRADGQLQHGDVISANINDYAIARRLLIGPLGRSLGGDMPTAVMNFGVRLVERFEHQHFSSSEAYRADKIAKRRVNDYLVALEDNGFAEIIEASRGPKPAVWRMVAEPDKPGARWLPEPQLLLDQRVAHA